MAAPAPDRPDRPRRPRAVAEALFVTFLWSTSWVLIKVGLRDLHLEPLTFAGLRYSLAALLLLPLAVPLLRRARPWRGDRRVLVGVVSLGVLLYGVTQGAQFAALELLPATAVGLMLSATPAVVAALASLGGQERASLGQAAGIGIFTTGAVLYFGALDPRAVPLLGLVIAVAGVLANAVSALLGRGIARSAMSRVGGPIGMTAVGMAVGAAILLGTGLVLERPTALSAEAWLILGWLAIVNTALAFVLWNDSLRTLTAVESSVLNNLMLVQIAILAWVFLGEALGGAQIVGLALALVGIAAVQLAPTVSALRRPGPEPLGPTSGPAV